MHLQADSVAALRGVGKRHDKLIALDGVDLGVGRCKWLAVRRLRRRG